MNDGDLMLAIPKDVMPKVIATLLDEWMVACSDRNAAWKKIEELNSALDADLKTIAALEAQVRSLQSALDYCRKTVPQTLDHMAKRVDELDLSVRAANCLQALGIETVRELTKTTFTQLLSQKHLTKKVLEEIRAELAKLGLRLRGDK